MVSSHIIFYLAIHPETNPRIQDFDNIVRLAKERNWNLVFNLLAENTQQAQQLVGKELINIIRKNRDLLVNRYQRQGVLVVDNLEKVKDEYFVDRDWPTEHYSEEGRRMIAEHLAVALKTFYPNAFVQFQKTSTRQAEFFNNCDEQRLWGQMQTIKSGKSFSGNFSSWTGKDQIYSLTFEKGIKYIKDSCNQVDVEAEILRESIADHPHLVIQIRDKEKLLHSLEFPLAKKVNKAGKWQHVHHVFNLPPDFYQAAVVKIFIYSESNTWTYLDDFRIKFK